MAERRDAGPRTDWFRIASGAVLHGTALVYQGTVLAQDVVVEEYCVLGKPHRDARAPMLLNDESVEEIEDPPPTIVSNGCYIQSHSVLYAGARLGERVICTDYCSVHSDAIVGDRCKLQYRATINARVTVGADCRIGGFLCDDTRIGARTSFYGKTVHAYDRHGGGDDAAGAVAPMVGSDVIVGFDAVLIGGITVGDGAYIGAGAVVTRDVPDGAIVVNANEMRAREDWPGRMGRRGS